jgi:catecholate siderophore receptor
MFQPKKSPNASAAINATSVQESPTGPLATLLPLAVLMLSMSAAQAQTLENSGESTSATKKTQKNESTLSTVNVTARRERDQATYQSGTVSSAKVPVPAKDVPQSLTVVNEKLIHDQGKDTVIGALQNVPGITFEAGEGGRIGDNIRLRGFSISGDIYADGLRDIAQYNRDTFNVDRVEVMRGSASMLFGRGSTGGIVNQVSKVPRLMTEHEVNTTVGTQGYSRVTGDFNFKTGDDAALRINAMKTDGLGRADKAETHRNGLALDYRWGIGTADEFMASLYHLDYKDKPDFGFGWLANGPAPAPTAAKWYGVDSDYQKDSADVVTLKHTHRWADGSTQTTTLRDGNYQRDLWATTARVGFTGGQTTNLDNFGPNTVVTRASQSRAGQEHHTFLQSDHVTKGTWLGLEHQVLVGAELAIERSTRYTYDNISAKPNTTVGQADNTPVIDNRIKTWANDFTANTLGLYVQDTISLTQQWKWLAGLRHDRFGGNYDRATGGNLSRSDSVTSYRTGLMLQPNDYSSYYLSYGTSFNTSGDLYQYDPVTANTPPEQARNIELGAKWELAEGDLSLRTALARTDKYNERNTDTTQSADGTQYLLSGQRHTDALEFEVAGRLSPQWDIFGGLVFMRAVIDQAGSSDTEALKVGQNPGLTPARQANVWTTYKLDYRWRLGGGVTASSENKPANAETSQNLVPGFVRADLMAELKVDEKNTFKLNIDNLFDTVYYTSLYRGFVVPGAPRTVRATWTLRF